MNVVSMRLKIIVFASFLGLVGLALFFYGISMSNHVMNPESLISGTYLMVLGIFLGIPLTISLLEASSRFPTREHHVQFENGEVRLAGTLILPEAPGPHPAMVIVHGSGAADRHNWEAHTQHFPSLGVALLKFDKRGVGESTGNWLTAGAKRISWLRVIRPP